MQPPPHHATFDGYHTPPFAPIPLNSSLGRIWYAPDSIGLYMATTFGWNHLNRSLLYHYPKMSSLFYRFCLISERISPLHPSTSALTAFNTLDLSSLMGRRTRGATCGHDITKTWREEYVWECWHAHSHINRLLETRAQYFPTRRPHHHLFVHPWATASAGVIRWTRMSSNDPANSSPSW